MSNTANWSYTNVAIVKPFEDIDQWNGQILYGDPYEIACTWTAEAKMERESGGVGGARGTEFISKNIIFTEDPRPKYLDMIQLGGVGEFQEIRSVTDWDMSFFGETPDFKLVT